VRSRNAVRALNGKRFTESVSYSQTQRDIKIVRFTYRPLKRVKSINLVGDFNNWDTSKTPMIDPDRNGIYEVMLPLPPGKYSYKILIDGKKLVADYAAGVFEDDGNGGRKSVIIVR
jgi:1,4-alpha-glucan branching enzyme